MLKILNGKSFGMEQNKFRYKIAFLAIGFFLLNLVFKLIYIQSTPPAATYDEIIYVAEAQSIVKYGTDLTGGWRPWNLEPSDAFYTELTSTVLTPGFLIFPNNPILASKFIPLLLGSLLPILLGLIAYRLKKESMVFIITTILATLNPLVFQFSRMGYDSFFSIGFYSIAMVFLLYFKKWQKMWAMIPLFLGFYQYQGHKPLIAPLILICFLFILFEKYKVSKMIVDFKKIIKDKEIIASFLVLLFSVALMVIYVVRLPNLTSGERISEFSFYDQVELASQVNQERRLSLDSSLTPLFINKYTVLSRVLAERFLNSFNPKRLFIAGNKAVDTFTVFDYGYFHLVDIVVIAISLLFFFGKKKDYKILGFVFSYIVVGTIPNVIRTGSPWIIFRGAFVFLGILLLMGIGLSSFLGNFKHKYRPLIIVFYVLLTLPFFFIYFKRYPISHATNTSFYERVLASYVDRVGEDRSVLVVPDRADATFNYLISYNQLLSDENHDQINKAAQTKIFEVNNVKIASNCPKDIVEVSKDTTTLVYIFKKPCEPQYEEGQTTKIKSLIDGGLIFLAYNDQLCSQYDLGTYPSIKKNILAVEKLSDEEFCKSFFSRD